MRTRQRLHSTRVASVVVLALTGVGCGADIGAEPGTTATAAYQSPSNTGATGTPTSSIPKPGTTITSAASAYGQILWGPNRQVVYIWEKEPTKTAECYGDCAKAWPPVLTTSEPVAAGEVDATLLGTTIRRDGSTQVTYNGHPLYYYAHEGPGEVKCHDVATHGGLWWVITPAGERAA